MLEGEPAATLVERWRAGDQTAADEIHRRYTRRLWALAERQLGERLQRRLGPEDIVQSVFRTFFRHAAQGEYPIDQSGSLWHLLVTITMNKVRREAKHHCAAKRDVGAEIYPDHASDIPYTVAQGPSPEDAVALVDELERVVAGLAPPELEVVRLCFEGHSAPEIASRVGCSRWTVRRVLDRVGVRLRKRLECDSGS